MVASEPLEVGLWLDDAVSVALNVVMTFCEPLEEAVFVGLIDVIMVLYSESV